MAGRPRKYSEVEKLQKKIDEYFDFCDEKELRYTVPGLAYHLGFLDRRSITVYKENAKFFPTIKKALLRIESQRNQELLNENNSTGKIFDLKNNFGWKDRQEIEHTGQDGGPIAIEITIYDKEKDESTKEKV